MVLIFLFSGGCSWPVNISSFVITLVGKFSINYLKFGVNTSKRSGIVSSDHGIVCQEIFSKVKFVGNPSPTPTAAA
jgi:hypothetical protein